jgi:hypothetical protein
MYKINTGAEYGTYPAPAYLRKGNCNFLQNKFI